MSDPRIATLTIPSGQTESNVLDLRGANTLRPWYGTLYAPATLPETVTVHVADRTGAFGTLQSPPATDITIPAGKRIAIGPITASRLKLVASAGVAADRVFTWEATAAR